MGVKSSLEIVFKSILKKSAAAAASLKYHTCLPLSIRDSMAKYFGVTTDYLYGLADLTLEVF